MKSAALVYKTLVKEKTTRNARNIYLIIFQFSKNFSPLIKGYRSEIITLDLHVRKRTDRGYGYLLTTS